MSISGQLGCTARATPIGRQLALERDEFAKNALRSVLELLLRVTSLKFCKRNLTSISI